MISNHCRDESSRYATAINWQEMYQILEMAIKNELGGICISGPVVPAVPLKWWHEVLPGPSLPHESGIRMTCVSQTPVSMMRRPCAMIRSVAWSTMCMRSLKCLYSEQTAKTERWYSIAMNVLKQMQGIATLCSNDHISRMEHVCACDASLENDTLHFQCCMR